MTDHYRLLVWGVNRHYIESRLPQIIKAKDPHDLKCSIQNCLTDHSLYHNDLERPMYEIVVGGAWNDRCYVMGVRDSHDDTRLE